ncbi:MAG TPA: 2,3-bisphosphoglycerate-independent phosphoglycerate mutase [Cryomorphaceae bacterium]|nr:2,3-bisphosphoglycerate-independent phosphoglycerate mutase [Cryomorphaceae bacterium]
MKKTALIVLDGWGRADDPKVSAIDLARTPYVDSLYTDYPSTWIKTSGLDVGLPDGQMGNSEVGHMNLGAGRVVYQDLVKVNLAAESGDFETNPTLQKALSIAQKGNKKIHIMGLLSDGGVHAHISHVKALCSWLDNKNFRDVYIHAFTDGRDTSPKGGAQYLEDLTKHMMKTTGQIASVIGRYFAMDRDQRWERVARAYDLLVHGSGTPSTDPISMVRSSYHSGITDEFMEPIIATDTHGKPLALISKDDVVIMFNYRTDRGREITQALTQRAYSDYNMSPLPLHYVTMTSYDDTFKDINVVFRKDNLVNTLGEVLEKANKTQIRIAETEKYPHVTFFFSGGREVPYIGEQRLLCPSPKVATYDLQPEMSAADIRDAIVPKLKEGETDFICLNFANPDMVGHTGVMSAAVKACEVVDRCLRDVVAAGLESDYQFIILADHGNADCMVNKDGTPNTAHTTTVVPCFLVGSSASKFAMKEGKLGDIAPTLLALMDVKQPSEMTGDNLLISK